MHFYNYIFTTTLICTFLHRSSTDSNIELLYPESGIIAPSPLSIGLIFFIKINNTSDRNDYDIEITPDECCLKEENRLDCDSLQILGGCTDFVPQGVTKTVSVIAPLLNQYERKGHCVIYIDSKSSNGQNKRDTIKIIFDTAFDNNKFDFLGNFKHCEHKDEDPFNDCKPVNCDTYYNSKKPYFSRKYKRCIEVPTCVENDDYIYPSVIYNPITNQCLKETIIKEDLQFIKKNIENSEKNRKRKDVLIINKFRPNTTELTGKDLLIDDIVATTTSKHINTKQLNTKFIKVAALNLKPTRKPYNKGDCFEVFLKKYFIDNKWTLMILVLVVTVQCFLICTMIYCLSKTCNCCEDKRVIRKFFNYRQDVSVTTPLINTSNIDTETTEYQYLTESSNNIDQKMKCYKACQKENNNNVKLSMSDDILSKCVNRRDWIKFKSEAITEPEINTQKGKNNSNNTQANMLPKTEEKRTPNETKVMFEDEKSNIIETKKLTLIKNAVEVLNETKGIEENLSSEKEIKCHSYNRFDAGVAGFHANLGKNVGHFRDAKSRKGTISNSTEKGAQAYFSNDSIDDFISERGVIYLAGENMSKYTFSTGSNDMKPSITSSVSSKTSKNFVKNVLSLLHKRSKQGPRSDPGQNKEIDLELIHMSRASVYSSTNDSDCMKTFKRKDSRTSF